MCFISLNISQFKLFNCTKAHSTHSIPLYTRNMTTLESCTIPRHNWIEWKTTSNSHSKFFALHSSTTRVKIKNKISPTRPKFLCSHPGMEYSRVPGKVFFSCFFCLLQHYIAGWMVECDVGGYYMSTEQPSCLPVRHIFPKQPFLCNRIHHPGMDFRECVSAGDLDGSFNIETRTFEWSKFAFRIEYSFKLKKRLYKSVLRARKTKLKHKEPWNEIE